MCDNMLIETPLEKEVKESYLTYALSVIVSRAIPDARDGLKPVQRRILYSMNELGLKHNKPYKKSARVVGEVLGKYHPHGDSAIYDALVRMAQPFSLRYTLVDGQGNFGSIDGDPPAAMRYTEVRMAKIAEEMLKDIEFNTVDFQPNFDNSLKEPVVLPSRIPNLLINGTSGIAVGMASNIPPHNLGEVIDALIAIIDGKDKEHVLSLIRGPDFPTGGIILGKNAIEQYKRTGKAIIKVRAKTEIKDDKILITEIPFQVTKTRIINEIVKAVNSGVIEGIADLHDRSDKRGLLIEIRVKKNFNPEIVLNKLFKHSSLETSFGIIQIALVKGKPKTLSLYELLNVFLEFREEVIRRRTSFLLKKAEERFHILEGLLTALESIDKVISIIRNAKTQEDALNTLMNTISLSEKQAKAVLEMKLQTLIHIEKEKLIKEKEELKSKISEFKEILVNREKLYSMIRNELIEVKNKFADERRTEIVEAYEELDVEDLIPNTPVVISLSKKGYVKRIPLNEFKVQHRGGKGVRAARTEQEIEDLIVCKNHDTLLVFTDKGYVHWLKAYRVPKMERYAKGVHISSLINVKGEIVEVIAIQKFDESYLLFATEKGLIKKTKLMLYSNPRKGGIIAIKLRDNDKVVGVKKVVDERVLLATENGMSLTFDSKSIRDLSRASMGVKGIRLKEGDKLKSMAVLNKEFVVFITQNGFGKRTRSTEFPVQRRGGQGVIAIRLNEGDKLVGCYSVGNEEHLLLISEKGQIIRIPVSEISVVSRYARGVKVARFNEKIKSFYPIREV